MEGYKLFWGDSHANIHSEHIGALDTCLAVAREMLDFLPMAYYPYRTFPEKGFVVEDWLPEDRRDREWKTVCDFAAANDRPGRLVIFPGYEWQGTGVSGDHNVYFLNDHPPLIRCDTLRELYDEIRTRRLKALAIPHHTAYTSGIRGKDWSVHDSELSPFAEIFSVHGCSESDDEWIGLRRNIHMGPGVSGGTTEEALDRGYRLGIICSNDSHGGYPAVYEWGLMACFARELTRESLWEAFRNRRVFGVTGDRIELDFTVESAPMGSVIRKKGPVRVATQVRCTDALDRIELLRNNRVIATHCHNGTWDVPSGSQTGMSAPLRCKLRVEAGWNPDPEMLPDQPPRDWDCSIEVPQGAVVGVEKCWKTPGQRVGAVGGSRCDFGFHTVPGTNLHTEATVFELEGRPTDEVRLRIEGKPVTMTLAEAMSRSRLVHFTDENRDVVRRAFGLDPDALPRLDRLYFLGPKAKIHRAVPEAGFTGRLDYVDSDPPAGTNHYRVRVLQRNRQMAWSSPVWVEN
jgi:hypothetical protein